MRVGRRAFTTQAYKTQHHSNAYSTLNSDWASILGMYGSPLCSMMLILTPSLDKRFDWTSADLAAFNIVVQDQDQDTFFDGPLPDYLALSRKEKLVFPRNSVSNWLTMSNVPEKTWMLTLLRRNDRSMPFWTVYCDS